MSIPIVQTVGSAICAVFPFGTNVELFIDAAVPASSADDPHRKWLLPPEIPTDLFAVSGHLCKLGGIIGFFNPDPYATDGEDGQFILDRDFRDTIDDIAWEWRGGRRGGRTNHKDFRKSRKPSGAIPEGVTLLWKDLIDNWERPINNGHYVHARPAAVPARWWRAALALMIISDLAVLWMDRKNLSEYGDTPFGHHMRGLFEKSDQRISMTGVPKVDPAALPTIADAPRGPASLTFMADTSIVCVLPKLRITPVGTTLRNVSRNLALLPGRGEMRCFWHIAESASESEDAETLDILLVPAPYRLNAVDFKAIPSTGAKNTQDLHTDKPNWENFALHQSWIASDDQIELFVRDVSDMLRASRKSETRRVNAVILPEYCLTSKIFARLCDALKAVEAGLEFVISGSSDNCEGRKANTLLTRVWEQGAPRLYQDTSRRKHHRWRLDRRQVESYGLGTALNPKINNWWEQTPIGQRELYFHHFRKDSVFSALICEELARSDVCHDILRAVGPNLVFALLMDSAQMPSRWPGQYAAALADDPGSAVLSLTSYGLVERSNRSRSGGSKSIALWKDDTGKQVTIDMPDGEGARGVLLSLWSEHLKDQTIIGKRSVERAWRYSSHVSVRPGKGI